MAGSKHKLTSPTSKWQPVCDSKNLGVAIANYSPDLDHRHRLPLLIGDGVIIFQQLGDWYHGCLARDSSKQGIFPSNFIAVKNPSVDSESGNSEYLKKIPIIQELSIILREWEFLARKLYIKRAPAFEPIRLMILDLLSLRSQVIKRPPISQLDGIKQLIATKIDEGNALLGLDLVVRDEQGCQLDPENTSTIDLFRAHEFAMRRRKGGERNSGASQKTLNYVHNLVFHLRNFVCRIGDDADLICALFDAKEMKFISENYVVNWSKDGFVLDLEKLDELKVVFTDLGGKDMLREKIFFVCQVVRIGGMDTRDTVESVRAKSIASSKKCAEGIRRPFGVAAMDITDIMTGRVRLEADDHQQVPFYPCEEKDSLESIIRKFVNFKSTDTLTNKYKDQGLWCSFNMLHGSLKQLVEDKLIPETISVSRKMAFPEVICPGDVRNDLYLTLVAADFSSRTFNAKNVEVTVRVCDQAGNVLSDVISTGSGCQDVSEYKSVVYYHEEKPRWLETFRIRVSIEDFMSSHVKFLFKHRSSNENKDKNEKYFALSFIKLKNADGTAILDNLHDLLVFKIGSKKFYETDASYLKLPSTHQELNKKLASSELELDGNATLTSSTSKLVINQFSIPGLTLTPKESFNISTVICSTKLTQNVDLLALLQMNASEASEEEVTSCLEALLRIESEEIFKNLQDTLDALFKIFIEKESNEIDHLFFRILVRIIDLISDRKYENFRPDLDSYIERAFAWPSVYPKLMSVLKQQVDNIYNYSANGLTRTSSAAQMNIIECDMALNVMQSLEYLFRFIVRSRILHATLEGGRGKVEFETSLRKLLASFVNIMSVEGPDIVKIQAHCLKHFPAAIPHLITVFNGQSLSLALCDLITKIPLDKLKSQKIGCISDIIHMDCLFKQSECRKHLLPVINDHLRILMNQNDRQHFTMCTEVLSDILGILHGKDVGPIKNDVNDLTLSILRPIIELVTKTSREDPFYNNLVSILLALLRPMTMEHFNLYFNNFRFSNDSNDQQVVNELLIIFKDMVSEPVFPPDCVEMIFHQNQVILSSMRFISKCIRDRFSTPFEPHLWSNYFHCAISFLTQPSLQLENYSVTKRNRLVSKYRDMRQDMAIEVRSMWFKLGSNKIQFVPNLVGPLLEMTLIPDTKLRRETLPIFFDMMQCEYYEPIDTSNIADCNGEPQNIRGNFSRIETEIITQLDKLVEAGKGDEEYKSLFKEVIGDMCESHPALCEQGNFFVKIVVSLLKRLLEYRQIMSPVEEDRDNSMLCIVNILEFYNQIHRQELYIRYLYKLVGFHLKFENYIEAAQTLNHHARLLEWSDRPLPRNLRCSNHPDIVTHRQLKERLYLDIIDYFDKGKLWEEAIRLCKELEHQYERETFDYLQLSSLLQKMSTFYSNIMEPVRPEPEYFRVGFFGQGFHSSIRNKNFVYRGKEYERLPEFQSRLLTRYPNAQLLGTLGIPTDDVKSSEGQFVLINAVEPLMQLKEDLKSKNVSDQILKYYRVNEVRKFSFSRRVRKSSCSSLSKDSSNEFAFLWVERTVLETTYPLPGILRMFPVKDIQTIELSPIENAIEIMESTNNDLKSLVLSYLADKAISLNNLSMKLKGVIDAAVNGGIMNYEKAFFTDSYLQLNPSDRSLQLINRLKDCIALQIPLLDIGISIHRERVPVEMRPFHEHLELEFQKMKSSLEEKYGRRSLPAEVIEARSRRTTDTLKVDKTLKKSEDSKSVAGTIRRGLWKKAHIFDLLPNKSKDTLDVGDKTIQRKSKEMTQRDTTWYFNEGENGQPERDQMLSRDSSMSSLSLSQHCELRPRLSDSESYRLSGSTMSQSSPNRSQVTSIVSNTSSETISEESVNDTRNKTPPPVPAKTHHVTSASDLTQNGFDPKARKVSLPISGSKKPPIPLPDEAKTQVHDTSDDFSSPPAIPARKPKPEILPRRSLHQRVSSET